jgi:hypothetical protein
MKNVIVFQERFGKEDYRIYQLDAKQTFYDSLTEPGKGFSVQTTIDYSNGFTFFDTVPDAEIWIKERITGMVDAADADVFCPKCNRGYEARDKSEDEWVWVYNKTCACDHTFKVEGRQIILYKVITD